MFVAMNRFGRRRLRRALQTSALFFASPCPSRCSRRKATSGRASAGSLQRRCVHLPHVCPERSPAREGGHEVACRAGGWGHPQAITGSGAKSASRSRRVFSKAGRAWQGSEQVLSAGCSEIWLVSCRLRNTSSLSRSATMVGATRYSRSPSHAANASRRRLTNATTRGRRCWTCASRRWNKSISTNCCIAASIELSAANNRVCARGRPAGLVGTAENKQAVAAQPRPGQPRALKLPDLHPILRRQVQLVARLHLERGIPRVEVAHGFGSELRRRVTVGGKALAQGRVAHLRTPGLAEGEEEALVATEAVDHRRGLAVE